MSPSGKIKKSEPPLHFPFMQEENRLSMAMENYLLSILRLEEQEIKVTVVGLSDHLKIYQKLKDWVHRFHQLVLWLEDYQENN